MSEYTIREQLKEDALNSFHNALKAIRYKSPYASMGDVIKLASSSRAPRFYTTVEKASEYISILKRGKKLPLVNGNKINMYVEIYRRYSDLWKSGRNSRTIIEEVISQESPSFYLNEDTFRDIIYKKLSKKKQPCH